MYRNPFLDVYAGMLLALGGPLGLLLPQRIFLAALSGAGAPKPPRIAKTDDFA